MNKKVFISYSHQDNVCARGIARFLVRQGYNVWIDVDKLVSGQSWANNINEALRAADTMIALISKNSVRRTEVLREISESIDRNEKDKSFQVLFVVIGNVHPSWFPDKDNSRVKKIIKWLQVVQFIQLDAKGTISISKMQDLIRALNGKMIYSNGIDFSKSNEYVYEAAVPEKVYDNIAENCFYRVHTSDLAPSTAFPFALDNQWLPDEIISDDSDMKGQFLRYGFEAENVQQFLETFQIKNLYLALIHTRQLILNRAAILNSKSLQKLYFKNKYDEREKIAFAKLLENGSIIVFLYGNNELSPYIYELPEYSTMHYAVDEWNRLCTKITMYCIRENWETPVDRHSQEFVKQCTTLAFNEEINNMLAECFGFDALQKKEFFATLKEIEMSVFLQTHIIGTGHRTDVKGYSRSAFYRNFVVVNKSEKCLDPVLNCIFDEKKPFHKELKKIIDVYYNSIFTNFFNCTALIPSNIRPEDTFIYQLYLRHGIKEVGVDELEYAFSEFFQNEEILNKIGEIGDDFYIDNWSLDRIIAYREGMHWREYIELVEYITNRSNYWEVDFSNIEKLVELFVESVKECSAKKGVCAQNKKFTPSYTFRICIGSKVLDIICNQNVRKLKKYKGILAAKTQNNLSIQFLIGDSTSMKAKISESIFLPIKIFDGRTNYVGGNSYFEELSNFLTEQCEFMWIY
nr:toll/interleukin-1 receptor domain-containing protein [uncultured Anaerobutyricum sp.]